MLKTSKNAETRKSDTMLVTLTFRALPDEVPAACRLKRLLKLALRSFGFRVDSVQEFHAGQDVRGSVPGEGAAADLASK